MTALPGTSADAAHGRRPAGVPKFQARLPQCLASGLGHQENRQINQLDSLCRESPRGPVTVHERAWRPDDIKGAAIAVGAFAEDADASAFAEAARAAGVPVNVIDKRAFCDFGFGAIVNRSPLVIGISTDGAAPIFAQAIRAKLERLLPRGFAIWAAAAQGWRFAVSASGLSFAGRREFWQLFAAHAVVHARASRVRRISIVCWRESEGRGPQSRVGR